MVTIDFEGDISRHIEITDNEIPELEFGSLPFDFDLVCCEPDDPFVKAEYITIKGEKFVFKNNRDVYGKIIRGIYEHSPEKKRVHIKFSVTDNYATLLECRAYENEAHRLINKFLGKIFG